MFLKRVITSCFINRSSHIMKKTELHPKYILHTLKYVVKIRNIREKNPLKSLVFDVVKSKCIFKS